MGNLPIFAKGHQLQHKTLADAEKKPFGWGKYHRVIAKGFVSKETWVQTEAALLMGYVSSGNKLHLLHIPLLQKRYN